MHTSLIYCQKKIEFHNYIDVMNIYMRMTYRIIYVKLAVTLKKIKIHIFHYIKSKYLIFALYARLKACQRNPCGIKI
jgi:hypothetical protein